MRAFRGKENRPQNAKVSRVNPIWKWKQNICRPHLKNWIMLPPLSPGFSPSERNRKQSGTLLFNTFNFLPRFWYPSALPSSPFFFASLRSTMVLPIWFGCTFGLSGFFLCSARSLCGCHSLLSDFFWAVFSLCWFPKEPQKQKREKRRRPEKNAARGEWSADENKTLRLTATRRKC